LPRRILSLSPEPFLFLLCKNAAADKFPIRNSSRNEDTNSEHSVANTAKCFADKPLPSFLSFLQFLLVFRHPVPPPAASKSNWNAWELLALRCFISIVLLLPDSVNLKAQLFCFFAL
jgi:hypothetical protein